MRWLLLTTTPVNYCCLAPRVDHCAQWCPPAQPPGRPAARCTRVKYVLSHAQLFTPADCRQLLQRHTLNFSSWSSRPAVYNWQWLPAQLASRPVTMLCVCWRWAYWHIYRSTCWFHWVHALRIHMGYWWLSAIIIGTRCCSIGDTPVFIHFFDAR